MRAGRAWATAAVTVAVGFTATPARAASGQTLSFTQPTTGDVFAVPTPPAGYAISQVSVQATGAPGAAGVTGNPGGPGTVVSETFPGSEFPAGAQFDAVVGGHAAQGSLNGGSGGTGSYPGGGDGVEGGGGGGGYSALCAAGGFDVLLYAVPQCLVVAGGGGGGGGQPPSVAAPGAGTGGSGSSPGGTGATEGSSGPGGGGDGTSGGAGGAQGSGAGSGHGSSGYGEVHNANPTSFEFQNGGGQGGSGATTGGGGGGGGGGAMGGGGGGGGGSCGADPDGDCPDGYSGGGGGAGGSSLGPVTGTGSSAQVVVTFSYAPTAATATSSTPSTPTASVNLASSRPVSAAEGAGPTVTVGCAGPAGDSCPLTLTLSAGEATRAGQAHAASRRRRRTVEIATAKVTLLCGPSQRITLALNPAGRVLLDHHRRLAARLRVTQTKAGRATAVAERTLTLTRKR